jgi:hypothetical protein
MIVDRSLVEEARRLLQEVFPDGPGRACAMYSVEGRLYTGAAAKRPSAESAPEPEEGPMGEAVGDGALIAASVTVGWDGPGTPVVCRTPAPSSLEKLAGAARRNAQVAVSSDIENLVVRPLSELIPERPNSLLMEGRYAGGMKAIGPQLTSMAREHGVPLVRVEFEALVLEALAKESVRRNAAAPAFAGGEGAFATPMHLESVALRHVWLAFELAAIRFVVRMVDAMTASLEALGCGPGDLVHVKQGGEAVHNVFASLLVVVGRRSAIENEMPFFPYHAGLLRLGVPIDAYLALGPPPDEADTALRNGMLVRELVRVLGNRGEGGLLAYLRQRRLYEIDVFGGGGTGHCPFSSVSGEMLLRTSAALERALAEGTVLLAPDRPA